ncbi:MAG: hypothetical protein ABR975_11625 [Vulcanimicrobiaceae bacterium]|jgi:hypothetical protein
MKRAPQLPGVDLSIYPSAAVLLVRNPTIIVVPLLMAVVGVLINRVLVAGAGAGGLGGIMTGLAWLIEFLLLLFGLGAACIIADDAWRHSRASFEKGWVEARRRAPEILMTAIGVSLLFTVAQIVTQMFGVIGYVLLAVIAFFLIFAIPASAVGGVPGAAAIQVSIDRVRANPLSAALATIVTIVLTLFVAPIAAAAIDGWLAPYDGGTTLVEALALAVFQSIAIGYSALAITKSYTDAAFGRRF